MNFKENLKKTILFVSILLLSLPGCKTEKQQKTTRVILVGIYGVSLSGFERAKTPNIDKLIKNGAIPLKTRAVMPTVSGPMGFSLAWCRTGTTWNYA